ncbi:MAG: type II secretion system GspH family protein [Patescibacteria group bacterium]|nr:type II secretion system GspH family protein [Patescibacteria group bacterium]MCL5432089.1 type II secretion system GspH family protein [Patescibacteria group bacterium]
MIVIAVIAILATISLFGLTSAQKSARDTQREQMANAVRASLERYNGDNNGYPNSGGNFSDMYVSLTTGNYLSSMVDPGCGTGQKTFTTQGAFSASQWWPCGAGTLPSYSYSSVKTGYSVVVYKEGGGSAVFASPQ